MDIIPLKNILYITIITYYKKIKIKKYTNIISNVNIILCYHNILLMEINKNNKNDIVSFINKNIPYDKNLKNISIFYRYSVKRPMCSKYQKISSSW